MNRLVETLPPPRCRDESVHRGSRTTLVCPLIPTHSSRGWDILPPSFVAPWPVPLSSLRSMPHPPPAGARNGAVGKGLVSWVTPAGEVSLRGTWPFLMVVRG